MRQLTLIAAFAAVYIIWGSTYLAIRFVLAEGVPPLFSAGARFLVAGLVLFTFARLSGAARPEGHHWRTAWIVGALLPAGGNGLVVMAQESGLASGVAALLVAIEPLWIALLAMAWQRERMPTIGWVGLLLGFVGVAVLIGPAELGAAPVDPLGGALVCLAALSWATGSLYSRDAPSPSSSALGSGMMMLTGGTILLGASALRGEFSAIDLASVGLRGWGAWLYLVVMGSIVALSAYLWLVRHVQPNRVATYAYVNPLIAVALGWLFADEIVDARIVLATAVIVLGVALMLAAKSAKRPRCESTA